MPEANSAPQFNTAEYAGQPAADSCHYCQRTIGVRYYRVNNLMACPACTEKAALPVPQNHAAFTTALLCGAGAAIAGLALYATIEIFTGLISSLVSLAIAWMVGTAMMAGSKGIGGRRYQIAAMLLTYAAVSMAAIPVSYARSAQSRKAQEQLQKEEALAANGQSELQRPPARPTVSIGVLLFRLALLGLASPFLNLIFARSPLALVSLAIIFIGMRYAWQITAGKKATEIIGPFSASPPALT
jgi:predicted lipid-binding transport protein (Tim44 family)